MHAAKIPGAIGRDDQALRAGGGRSRLRRELPSGGIAADTERGPGAIGENAGIDVDRVGVAIVQRAIARIERRLVARDENGMIIEIGLPTDRLPLRDAEFDLVDKGLGGDIDDLDLPLAPSATGTANVRRNGVSGQIPVVSLAGMRLMAGAVASLSAADQAMEWSNRKQPIVAEWRIEPEGILQGNNGAYRR